MILYVLRLCFHQVAVVGKLVMKLEKTEIINKTIPKRRVFKVENNIQSNKLNIKEH
jgi:hypothetical protein